MKSLLGRLLIWIVAVTVASPIMRTAVNYDNTQGMTEDDDPNDVSYHVCNKGRKAIVQIREDDGSGTGSVGRYIGIVDAECSVNELATPMAVIIGDVGAGKTPLKC